MTVKEYLVGKVLVELEIVPDVVILNLVTDDGKVQGMNVDTSNIPENTVLEDRTDFILTDDIIYCAGLSIDTTTTTIIEPRPRNNF